MRRVYLFAGMLSTLLLAASMALDIRSRFICDEFEWVTRQNYDHTLMIEYGRFQHSYPDDPPAPVAANPAAPLEHSSSPADSWHSWQDDYRLATPLKPGWAGFEQGAACYVTLRDDRAAEGYLIDVYPFWPLYVIFAPLSVSFLAGRIRTLFRSRKRKPGRCANCGYDLRATPSLCPECGVQA